MIAAAALVGDVNSQGAQGGGPSVSQVTDPQQGKVNVSWDSRRLQSIEQMQNSKDLSDLPREKHRGTRIHVLVKLLKERLSSEELHELAASFATTPVDPKEWKVFPCELIQALVDLLQDSADREGLITLLSTRCPPWVHRVPIEDILVESSPTYLEDPVLILGDAYGKSQVPQVREALALAVRRGFTGHGVRGKDDDEFVKNAMKWYEQNKSHLEPNLSYKFNQDTDGAVLDAVGPDGVPPAFVKNPLFKRKGPSLNQP
jgi:hypothetical protein